MPSYDMEPLRLETIHPELNEQVQHALEQIVEAFHDESPRLDPDVRKAQITVYLLGTDEQVYAIQLDLEIVTEGRHPRSC